MATFRTLFLLFLFMFSTSFAWNWNMCVCSGQCTYTSTTAEDGAIQRKTISTSSTNACVIRPHILWNTTTEQLLTQELHQVCRDHRDWGAYGYESLWAAGQGNPFQGITGYNESSTRCVTISLNVPPSIRRGPAASDGHTIYDLAPGSPGYYWFPSRRTITRGEPSWVTNPIILPFPEQ